MQLRKYLKQLNISGRKSKEEQCAELLDSIDMDQSP
jgi:hypothetical protein